MKYKYCFTYACSETVQDQNYRVAQLVVFNNCKSGIGKHKSDLFNYKLFKNKGFLSSKMHKLNISDFMVFFVRCCHLIIIFMGLFCLQALRYVGAVQQMVKCYMVCTSRESFLEELQRQKVHTYLLKLLDQDCCRFKNPFKNSFSVKLNKRPSLYYHNFICTLLSKVIVL